MGLLTATPQRFNFRLWALIALAAGLLGLISLSLFAPSRQGATTAFSGTDGAKIAYVEFGRTADTLWLASADDPKKRESLISIEHAFDFGIVPSLSPQGSRFAYTALAANTKAPAADTPAGLWLAALDGSSPPEALAENVDLLVRPVWTNDGAGVVVRRSSASAGDAGEFRLIYVDIATRAEREIAYAGGSALFPIAFAANNAELFVARLQADASELLAIDISTGATREAGRLADGLTRDWTLSPEGGRLAYLELSLEAGAARSRAYTLDLATGTRQPATDGVGDDFSPIWSPNGALTIGRDGAGNDASGLHTLHSGATSTLKAPARGFDVPLAASPTADAFVARSFDGVSAQSPGRPTLTLIRPDGARTTIAGGEVTFLGWTNP